MWAMLRVCLVVGLLVCSADELLAGARDASEWRFSSVDVFVDPAGRDLAAYQIEILAESEDLQIVGVEGGEHASFREPPYYDAAALGGGRIIIAAFSTSTHLPDRRSRVATLHVRWRDEALVSELQANVQAAADADGSPIEVVTELVIADGGLG